MTDERHRTRDDTPPVAARGLVKRYGDLVAVDHVDLTVHAGDRYGYLGPNGAGKTTLLRMLLGLVRPDAGVVRLYGRDPVVAGASALAGVGGFVEAPAFYGYLSARANLEVLVTLDGDRRAGARIDEVLGVVDLRARADDRLGSFSQGMRQRLGVAAALLRAPRLLILDEPTNGLDPAGMRDMRRLIGGLADRGITVLYSSHLLADVEQLCNRIAVIDHGRVLYEGAVDDLRNSAGGLDYRLECADPQRAFELAREMCQIRTPQLSGQTLHFTVDAQNAVGELTIALGQADIELWGLAAHRPSLEDLFFAFTDDDDRSPRQGPAPVA